ncbi:MAG: hypothetical protein IPO17_05240 [Flavobacteriales bacterium]|nr:hypothetical protein [Flavobacteriales bacterium]
MEVYAFIQEVRELLKSTFAGIDAWFDADPVLRGFRPVQEVGRSIRSLSISV